MREFLENDKGVHLMAAVHGGSFTLCGDSFDIAETQAALDFIDGALVVTKKRVITCPDCIVEIKNCRGVKTSY